MPQLLGTSRKTGNAFDTWDGRRIVQSPLRNFKDGSQRPHVNNKPAPLGTLPALAPAVRVVDDKTTVTEEQKTEGVVTE